MVLCYHSRLHAEGLGFNPQCVHLRVRARFRRAGASVWRKCKAPQNAGEQVALPRGPVAVARARRPPPLLSSWLGYSALTRATWVRVPVAEVRCCTAGAACAAGSFLRGGRVCRCDFSRRSSLFARRRPQRGVPAGWCHRVSPCGARAAAAERCTVARRLVVRRCISFR